MYSNTEGLIIIKVWGNMHPHYKKISTDAEFMTMHFTKKSSNKQHSYDNKI